MRRTSGTVKLFILLFFLLNLAFSVFPGGWKETTGLEFPGMMGVELEAGEMHVEIIPAEGDAVAFKAEGLQPGDKILHEFGDLVLRLRLVRSEPVRSGENPGTARLSLPPGMIVRVFTTTGNITARDQLADRLTAGSRSGTIVVKNFNAALDLRSTTGSIAIERSGGSKLLSSAMGGITVRDSDGGIDASTTTGLCVFERIRGRIYIHGGTGNVTVNNIRGALRIYSSTGAITCSNIFLTDDCDFRSNSGAIKVEFLNRASDVAFDLSTTTGEIILGDRKSNSEIVLENRARIGVTGRSSTGNQLYSFKGVSESSFSGFNPFEAGPGM